MSPHTVSHRTISLAVLVCLCCFTGLSVQCGPGRRSGRNQPRRRISPLVYKQYSPPLSEETLGASGQAEGAIQRGDVRFENLVENHNTDIIYRDEERDGSDRIMSKRCKEMLDRLAVLVQNEWPGNPPEVPPVKLKVKEAWDDKYVHGDNSLHYEGRAVDVATNDRDRSKLGMLAALAVTAGFDWVFYESHGHIHCSVKSDSSAAVKIGGCFPKESTVEAENRGTISMADLRVGDKVLSMRADGELENSEVMSFMDRNEAGYGLFYTLYTESGNQLILTAKHLVHVSESNSSLDLSRVDVIFADNVKEGDFVLLRERDSLRMDRVIEIKVKTRQGIYAPLTKHGTILVNGIVASCYAYIDNVFIAHTVFAPMRVFHDISQYMPSFDWLNSEPEVGSVSASGDTQTGMHWYARILYNIGMLVLDADTLYVQ